MHKQAILKYAVYLRLHYKHITNLPRRLYAQICNKYAKKNNAMKYINQ